MFWFSLKIRQAIPVGVHFHHAIVQSPHVFYFGIGCVFAGKPTGQSFEIPEHHETVLNILGAKLPHDCASPGREFEEAFAREELKGLTQRGARTPSSTPRLPS